MARPRFEKTDPAKQEAILQAAAKELARYGYEAASINRILKAAKLSKGAFYYYFDDKADLAATTLLWASRELFALYQSLRPPDDAEKFWGCLGDYLRQSVAAMACSPHSTELLSRLGYAFVKHPELADRVKHTIARPLEDFRAFWRRGQELGAVRSDLPVEALITLVSGIKESLIRVYFPDGRVPEPAELERIADLQLDLWRRICAPAQEGTR